MDKGAEELADLENANVEFTPFLEILIKQEPLDNCPETNAQDSVFNVVKQEVCGDKSEMEHSTDNNTDVAAPGSSVSHNIKTEPIQGEASELVDTHMDENQPVPVGDTTLTANNEDGMLKHLLSEYNIECHRCNICNYQCAYRSVLKKHMRIHTQEKPYSCEHCKFKCTRGSYLKQHMKIHTREKLYVASIAARLCQVVTRSQTTKKLAK